MSDSSQALSVAMERMAAKASVDFHSFAGFVLRDEKGGPIEQGVIHRVMHLHVQHCWAAGMRPLIMCPFGHGKSTQLSVGLVAYELGRDPTLRTKIVCQNDEKAMERVMGINALIKSPAYKFVFPHVRIVTREEQKKGAIKRDTQHALYLSRPGHAIDPSVQSAGVLSAGTGGRADLIIFDDVCDQKNSLDQPELRPKVSSNVENVWLQRLEPNGRALWVCTPWHEADASHVLMSNPGWSTLRVWVSDDFKRLECEVRNPPPGYPLPKAGSPSQRANGHARS